MADDYAEYVDSELAKISYDAALDHYRSLRQQFSREYAQFLGETDKDRVEHLLQQMIDEVNKDPIKNQRQTMNNIYKDIQNAIADTLTFRGKNNKIQLKDEYTKDWEERKIKAEDEFAKWAQSVLSDTAIQRIIEDQLSIRPNSGADINYILKAAIGFRNKILKQDSIKFRSLGHGNVNIPAGFCREVIIYKAFATALGKFNTAFDELNTNLNKPAKTMNFTVLHAGDIKAKQKVANKDYEVRDAVVDTPYDIYIDFCKKLSKADFRQRVEEEFDPTKKVNAGYGIQSKSWIEPWPLEKSSSFYQPIYSIGHRSYLLAQLYQQENKKPESWLAGVKFLSMKVPEVLGKRNVMWASGNTLMYTDDMIIEFKKLQYFIAFHKSEDNGLLLSEVRWEQNPYK